MSGISALSTDYEATWSLWVIMSSKILGTTASPGGRLHLGLKALAMYASLDLD